MFWKSIIQIFIMPKIHYYQRKRRGGKNFSLEQIFNDLRIRLGSIFEVKLVEVPYVSSGIMRRLLNVLYSIFNQGDINHITGDINYVNLLLKKKKNVLTILDCGIIHRKKGIIKKIIATIWFKLPVNRSSLVTVISDATKKDLLSVVNCNPDKIKIIYVPINEQFKYIPKLFDTLKPRILQIGAAPNKNLSNLILATKKRPCKLVIVGEISKENKRLIEQFNIEYENYIGLSLDEIIEQYIKSDILFFASTFEGFGMPILEAQATGRPVITSSILSMPEVGGDAAHYVDPYDVDAISNGINKIISDSSYRDQLIKKGLENIKRFDPEVIANQYKALYEEIIKNYD